MGYPTLFLFTLDIKAKLLLSKVFRMLYFFHKNIFSCLLALLRQAALVT